MSICLRYPAVALHSPLGPRHHPSRHPLRFAFSLTTEVVAVAVATLLLPHAAVQPLRLGGGKPVPPGSSEEDGFTEVSTGLYLGNS